jgi:predicted Zn finger-like uncharacterized protein
MALATKCPHCQTTFRVVNDQLKLRAGLVRCGHCKEIFNGIEHLLPPASAEAAGAQIPVQTQPSAAPPVAASIDAPVHSSITQRELADTVKSMMVSPPAPAIVEAAETSEHADSSSAAAIDASEPQASWDQAIASSQDSADADADADTGADIDHGFDEAETAAAQDPLQRMTLMDFTRELPDEIEDSIADTTGQQTGSAEHAAFNPQIHDELDAAIEDLQRKPWRKAKKNRAASKESYAEADDEEPNFVKRGRRQQRIGKKLRLFFGIASLLLFLAALAQGTYIFRNQIAGLYPQTKPALMNMCELLACRIRLPAQISLISIESSELQTLATGKDMFVLTALLRNKSRTAQEWPYIELTLNDNDEKPLLRRVFKPSDYINAPADIAQGILPDNERAVKLQFSLAQIRASGYRVYLFYP